MIYVENVPITIVETGETARATIEIYETSSQRTVLKIILKSHLTIHTNSQVNITYELVCITYARIALVKTSFRQNSYNQAQAFSVLKNGNVFLRMKLIKLIP